ncbi:MAG: hypothetical protein M3022_03220 [Actinomycetota bacterium]|nr:hypothetical protein [Actinomycetota bacterium]
MAGVAAPCEECEGGQIVFQGTPTELVAGRAGLRSLTGEHLAAYLGT